MQQIERVTDPPSLLEVQPLNYKTAVVTGAAGFVGRHLMRALRERGVEVKATDRISPDPQLLKDLDIEFKASDLLDEESLIQVAKGADVVFNPAGLFSYSLPYAPMYRVNVEGSRTLARAMRKAGIGRLMHWSTAEVYGRLDRVPADETTPPRPQHTYAMTKLLGEREVLRHHRLFGLPATVIRPTAIVGPHSVYGAINGLRLVYKGWMLVTVGQGDNLVNIVHIDDVVGAALHLANVPQAVGEIYNVADDSYITSREMNREVARILGKRDPQKHLKLPQGALTFIAGLIEGSCKLLGQKPLVEKDTIRILYQDCAFDNRKLKATGYQLKYQELGDYMESVLNWYVEHGMP